MIEQYGETGIDQFETWHIFGDASTEVWTYTPSQIPDNYVTITDNGSNIKVSTYGTWDYCVSSGDNGASFHEFVEKKTNHTFDTPVRPLYITVDDHRHIPYTAVTGGTFTSDEYWFGNLHVLGNVTFSNNKTLEILQNSNIMFDGYYGITINSGSKILAEGTESQPILFTSAPYSWRYVKLQGGNNRFKWCEFKNSKYYPLYLYICTASEGATNIIENCTFRNNRYYGLRIYMSVAKVKSCKMHDNVYDGIYCYNNPDVKFTGNQVYDNGRYGIRSLRGNFLEFYGNVIEDNGNNGISTRSGDHIHIGEPYSWYGYNTIRENGGHEVYVYSGSYVEMNYSSIHDDTGLEVYNYPGNERIYTQNCFWGVNGCQYSGSIYFDNPQNSIPGWDGQTFTGGPLGKMVARGGDGLLVDPSVSDEEKIKLCKEIIADRPKSKDAKEALVELYSVIRADYVENALGERNSFYTYLNNIRSNHTKMAIGKLALRYMIIWKMLENDDEKVIQLSKKALKVLTGEERKGILAGLALTYTHRGQLKEAKSILKEYKKKYTLDDLTELIEEDIADVEWQIVEGILEPYSPEAEPPIDPGEQKDISTPETFALFQNQPNPGNPITTIHYQLPEASKVTLKIYDLLGKEVRILVNDHRQAGVYSIVWDGKNSNGSEVPSGIYIYTLRAGNKMFKKKLTFMK